MFGCDFILSPLNSYLGFQFGSSICSWVSLAVYVALVISILVWNSGRLTETTSLWMQYLSICVSGLLSVRATSSEESGANPYAGEEPDSVVSTYDVPPPKRNLYSQAVVEEAPQEDPIVNDSDGQTQISEFLENLNIKVI